LYNSYLGSSKRPFREHFKSKLQNARENIVINITDNKAKQLVDVSGWRKSVRNA